MSAMDRLGPSEAAVDKALRAERQYRVARTVLAACVALLVVVVIALLVAVTVSTRNITQSVDDCLNPGGACYERSIRGQQFREQNLEQAQENGEDLARVLAILQVQFPDAYRAVVEDGATAPPSTP